MAKAKAAAREFVFQFPTNEGYTQNLINWLLDSAASDAEFQQDFTKLIEVRQKHPYWEAHRGFLPAWVQANAAKKDLAKRVDWAKAQLATSDKAPVFKDWIALENAQRQNKSASSSPSAGLLAPNGPRTLPDALAGTLFNYQQHYYLRHHTGAPRTPKA